MFHPEYGHIGSFLVYQKATKSLLLLNFNFSSSYSLGQSQEARTWPQTLHRETCCSQGQFISTLEICIGTFLLQINNILLICVCRHEDGTVRFWDASGVCLYPMYKLSTAGVFHTDADPNDNMNQGTEGEWPPFRKVCVCNKIKQY